MSLPSFSMRRPVTVIMFFLGITLFGLISWTRLQQELYPPIVYPQLSVVTFYKDAAPEEMEILVTKPVEEAVGTVSGVRRISSISKEETSLVVAEFNWATNMDFAALGVREKIDLIKESLPRGSEDPIVMKFNPFEMPLMVLNITSDRVDPAELRQLTDKIIKNEIEKADGVAAANITGGRIPEILVEIDQDKLMSKGLALNKVVEGISKANLNYPAGTIEESFYEYLIRTIGEFQVIDEISDLVVGIDDRKKKSEFTDFDPYGQPEKDEKKIPHTRLMFLKEIATVKEVLKEKTSVSRFNNQDNISLSIQKQADANTLQAANNVKDILSRLKNVIPKDVNVNIVADQSLAISTNIRGVRDAALQGGLLAFLVLLFFLRNIKSALIVALNIPVSMMVVFALMFLSGTTINMISLGGLALGVGMLVDNGIVVIENIYRHRQEEKRPIIEASIYGASEVSGAIAGSTFTTIAVFLPMIFVIGIAGQICKDLAFTVTFSLIGSLIAALTLIPILSARVKNIPTVIVDEEKGIAGLLLGSLQNFTQRVLIFFIEHKRTCLCIVLAVFIGSCLLLPILDTELLPRVDQGQFTIKLDLPPGTRLDFTDTVVKRIESYLFVIPEVDSVTVNIGSTKEKKGTAFLETMGQHQAQIIVNLKPKAGFKKTGPEYRMFPTADVLQKIKDHIGPEDLSGAAIEYILQESVFQTAFQAGAPVVVEIKGQELGVLRRITSEVEEELRKIPDIYSIRNTLVAPAPEVKVNVFKDKAATYNLSASDIALAAQTAIKGYIATKFKREGEEIDIRVQLREVDRNNMAKVRQLQLNSPLGIDVPLSELAYLSIGRGPSEIKRQDQERIVSVNASIFQRSFKEVADAVTSMLSKLNIPSAYSARLTGEREQIQESFKSLQMALILSILLVYMIMASQFESLWQPFVILFTIPLSIIGVIIILLLTATPLSVMVILGVIVLGGVVVNNGIVLIDYTNILRARGLSAYDAVITSSRRRLRPIIMTALTTILGLVPLAFALNEGAELQQPMAIAVIGGLAMSTFLSLIIIPTIYLGLDSIIVLVKEKMGKKQLDTDGEGPPAPPGGGLGPDRGPEPPAPDSGTGLSVSPHDGKGETKVEPPKIQYEDDIAEKPAPEKKDIKKDEIKPPIILPYEQDSACHSEGTVCGERSPELVEGRSRTAAAEESKGIASFSERQKGIIDYLKKNKQITRKEYADKFNISIPTAARDLKHLLKSGLIIPRGPAAVGRYYVLDNNYSV
jgi:hydrophobic/amphiphilic exporter-1 (mainly G- bacteria), HAE1 family